MISPNTILQDRYRVVRELGHGGMGTVYEAIDQRVNCVVALKETISNRDDEAVRAFEREAALLANLRHQALPKVMDYFSENDSDFLVMEFIPGYDLAELLSLRGSPFPQSQVLRWAHDLLRVLEYLHRQEPPILHRDIKPANLKLTKQGEIFLLDFGLAKGSVGQMPTYVNSRSVRGYTPVYASLEQIHGHGTDQRSDLYSLGATLYHLLTGVAPIDAPARFHAVEEEQLDPLQPIAELNPQTTENVSEVILQALSISRKQRPISAAEMRKALRNAAEEDERSSAEAEYARAEVRRRELEDARRKAEAEAARQAEEDRRLQEAETRKRDEAARLEREERLRAAEEAAAVKRRADEAEKRRLREEQLRADAAGRAAEPSATVAAPTIRSRAPEPPNPVASMKTIQAPVPERASLPQTSARATFRDADITPRSRSNKPVLVAAAVFVLLLGGALIVWLAVRSKTSNNEPAAQTTSANQPAENKSAVPVGMNYVPGGTFMMGNNDGDEAERPAHSVVVKPFYIDTYEVTNEDYKKFLEAVYVPRAPTTWKNGSFPPDAARKPVTGVLWEDANAYAKWVGKRLPTEEEWEFAARGTDGRRYPWGNEWQTGSANANGAGRELIEVGTDKGASPFGAYDMVGNAWEWTASSFKAYPGGTLPADQPTGDLKVIRGGSYESTKDYATTTYRTGWLARGASKYDQTGFRCVKDAAN